MSEEADKQVKKFKRAGGRVFLNYYLGGTTSSLFRVTLNGIEGEGSDVNKAIDDVTVKIKAHTSKQAKLLKNIT